MYYSYSQGEVLHLFSSSLNLPLRLPHSSPNPPSSPFIRSFFQPRTSGTCCYGRPCTVAQPFCSTGTHPRQPGSLCTNGSRSFPTLFPPCCRHWWLPRREQSLPCPLPTVVSFRGARRRHLPHTITWLQTRTFSKWSLPHLASSPLPSPKVAAPLTPARLHHPAGAVWGACQGPTVRGWPTVQSCSRRDRVSWTVPGKRWETTHLGG